MKPNMIINAILAGGLILLYILFFNSQKPAAAESASVQTLAGTDSTKTAVEAKSSIAYVTLDSILLDYKLYGSHRKSFQASTQSSQSQLQREAEQLQKEFSELQSSFQKGIMPQQMAEEKGMKLEQRRQQLMQKEQQMGARLAEKEQYMLQEIYDSIMVVVKDFNKTAGYEVIFNNVGSATILQADAQYSITDTILALANKKYEADSAALKK